MTCIRIKLKDPTGVRVLSFQDHTTVLELIRTIKEVSGIDTFEIRRGFPPKLLDLFSLDPNQRLALLEPKLHGEQLVVCESSPSSLISSPTPTLDANARSTARRVTKEQDSESTSYVPDHGHQVLGRRTTEPPAISLPSGRGTLHLRVMPDDNSCLFSAINHTVLGSSSSIAELRSIVANAIQLRPDYYTDAVLGRPKDEYCQWIQMESSWGGYIELSIFSAYFDLEICSIDVETLRVDHVNEGRPQRCILVYSGIHYDALVLSPGASLAPSQSDCSQFSATDEEVLGAALKLCGQLQNQGYFTNTSTFTLTCRQCNAKLLGQQGAVNHARETGHTEMDQFEGI